MIDKANNRFNTNDKTTETSCVSWNTNMHTSLRDGECTHTSTGLHHCSSTCSVTPGQTIYQESWKKMVSTRSSRRTRCSFKLQQRPLTLQLHTCQATLMTTLQHIWTWTHQGWRAKRWRGRMSQKRWERMMKMGSVWRDGILRRKMKLKYFKAIISLLYPLHLGQQPVKSCFTQKPYPCQPNKTLRLYPFLPSCLLRIIEMKAGKK